MDKQDKPKRKRVKDLQVHEISLVDNPAVPKAKFVIVKRKHSEGGDSEMTKCEKCGEMTKRGDEEYGDQSLPKAGEGAMDFLHRVAGQLVSMRRSFPVAIREMLMALDLAVDSTIKQEKPKEEEDEKKAAEAAEKEAAEKAGHEDEEDKKKAEKEAAEKEATEKAEKEAAEKEATEKAEKEAAEKAEADKGKKAEHQDCPPGMKFDIPSQKCVPMKEEEKKKSEVEKAAEEAKPAFDASLGEIEFSDEDQKGLEELLK